MNVNVFFEWIGTININNHKGTFHHCPKGTTLNVCFRFYLLP